MLYRQYEYVLGQLPAALHLQRAGHISVTNPDGDVVQYTYDQYGRKETLKYPDGRVVKYAYDGMDRLTKVTGLDGRETQYTYDKLGQRTQTTDGTLTTEYSYDNVGNLLKQATTGKTNVSFEYAYDSNNFITAEKRTDNGTSIQSNYTYDARGQLMGFNKSDGYSESYAYDPAGNMTQKSIGGVDISMTYNAANQLKSLESAKGKINYSYDKNGNLTSKVMGEKTDTYSYDAMDQLTAYTGYDGYQQRYTYNAQGMMSAKESKGNSSRYTLEEIVEGKAMPSDEDDDPDPANEWVKTSYIYDITMPYYEVLTEETNGVTKAYDYGIERIAAITSDFWYNIKTAYVYDGRGSVAQKVSYDISWYTIQTPLSPVFNISKSYTPFGEQLGYKTSGYGFNGEYYDAATGMVNLRARQYEPAMMRFMQKDTVKGNIEEPWTQNLYAYCANDPVNYVDPSGHSATAYYDELIRKSSVQIYKYQEEMKKYRSSSTYYKQLQKKLDGEKKKQASYKKAIKQVAEEGKGKKKSTQKISDYVNQYDAYWNRIDGYFSGEWWQNEGKRTQSYLMLFEEAVRKGQLNLAEINNEKLADETNNKMLGFQAIANALRTGNWDNGTLSAIEDGLVSKGIDGSEIVTAEQLAILFDRNITWRESGYWLETSGLSTMSTGVAFMVIAALRSGGFNCLEDDYADDVSNGFGDLSSASDYGIDTCKGLKKTLSGTGLESHHIVEKRLAKALGISDSNLMDSVAVTKAEHQAFTNAWRSEIPYGTDYGNLTKTQIWDKAQTIYKNYPELLESAKNTIFR